jgi:[acyl-carrier-protein] S-malonyltransferase
MKTAFAFPGVGVPSSGAEPRFFETHRRTVEPLLESAAARAGVDLVGPLLAGEVDTLPDRTRQFFTFAFSAGMAEVFSRGGIAPELVGGYSFGLYAALHAARAVGFDEGLELLDGAYRVMDRIAPPGSGMAVVVGLARGEVGELLEEEEFPSVVLTNTNSDTCQVVSGLVGALSRFCERALAADALSAELLDVRIPYHHPELLADATGEMARLVDGFQLTDSAVPVVSSIDQRPLTAAADLRRLVAENLSTPISWRRVVGAFHAAGIRRIVECGPGISLTRNGAFMPFTDLAYVNVKKASRSLEP